MATNIRVSEEEDDSVGSTLTMVDIVDEVEGDVDELEGFVSPASGASVWPESGGLVAALVELLD